MSDTTPQPVTGDWVYSEADKAAQARAAERGDGYVPQPGTEGLDFHLPAEAVAARNAQVEEQAAALVEANDKPSLEHLAEQRDLPTDGTKADIARRLVESGYNGDTPGDGVVTSPTAPTGLPGDDRI
jgi:hypothetical protein